MPSTQYRFAMVLFLSVIATPAFAGSGNGSPNGTSGESANGAPNGLPNGSGNGDYNGAGNGKPNGTSHSKRPDTGSDAALSHVPRPLPCLRQVNDTNSPPCTPHPQ